MSIESFLSKATKQFKKHYPEAKSEVKLAIEEQPADGLIIDNPQLEYILDRRFLAYGRSYLIYGKKGNSKTSLFYELAKTFQKQGGVVFFLETEHAVDLDYAKKQGVDLNKLYIEHPESLEQATTKIVSYIENLQEIDPEGNTPILICLDSIAGACPEYEQQTDIIIGETRVGEHARICSAFYRRLDNLLAYEKCVFVALNQLKSAIGKPSFGTEETEALIGGEAQRFHSTYQLKVARTKDLVKTDEHGADRKVGSRHEITCKRNKLGREGNSQKVQYDLYIDGGIDWYSALVRALGDNYKSIVQKDGGYYKWLIPDCKYTSTDAEGKPVEGVISTEDKMRESQLAQVIYCSSDAKEHIRTAFGIPPLPEKEVVEAIEKERKVKRKNKKKPDDESAVKAL